MNKLIRNIICAILMIAMIGAFIYLGSDRYESTHKKEVDSKIIKDYYSKLDKDNVFETITDEDMEKLFDKETGIMFVCVNDSDWCNEYAAVLDEAAKENEIEEIYFYNIKQTVERKTYYYDVFVDETKEYLFQDDIGSYNITTPLLFVVNNGDIVDFNNESSLRLGSIKPENYWQQNTKDNLKITLTQIFTNFKSIED